MAKCKTPAKPPAPPATPLRPVRAPVPEPADNLKAREEAFKRRRRGPAGD